MTWEALLRRYMSCLGSVPNCTIYVHVPGIVVIKSSTILVSFSIEARSKELRLFMAGEFIQPICHFL